MNAPAPGVDLALVVLAAGASERLGQPKALVELGQDASALALLLAAGASLGDPRPLVVTGRDHAALRAHVEQRGLRAELCLNPDWHAGRSGSVCCAVRQRAGRDLCLAPVDVPLVPASVFVALAAEWLRRGRPGRGWLGPCVRRGGTQHFGHPVIVGRDLARTLQDFPLDAPLSALRARAAPLLALAVTSPEILDDLDTPADLARLRRRRRSR